MKEFEEQLRWFIERSECGKKSDAGKIGIMFIQVGKYARKIYKMLEREEDGEKIFDKVKVLCDYCQPRKNVSYKCDNFWNPQQDEGKIVDAYTTRLRLQADYCNYDKKV